MLLTAPIFLCYNIYKEKEKGECMWGIVGTDGKYVDFFYGFSNDCWVYAGEKGYDVDHIHMCITMPQMKVVQPHLSEIIDMVKQYWIGKDEWTEF